MYLKLSTAKVRYIHSFTTGMGFQSRVICSSIQRTPSVRNHPIQHENHADSAWL